MSHAIRHLPGPVRRSAAGEQRRRRFSVLKRLRQVEEKGDSPATALVVLGHVVLALLVVVTLELALAMAFYFGWL